MRSILSSAFLILSLAVAQNAKAISIDWSGGYRIEYTDINTPTLSTDHPDPKSYGLQFLYLNSKIVASDGITINARFNILGTSNIAGYENSQLGTLLGGHGLTSDPQITSQNQQSNSVTVSQLYMNVSNEYGTLIAGRAPFEFGMGITHNAGSGPFDHWYDNRDGVAYKFYVDNISFMPMLSKVSQNDFGRGVTANDEIFVFEYKNKDNGAEAGVMQQTRKSSVESNDSNAATIPPFPGATATSGWTTKTVNIFLARTWDSFKFRMEAGFLTGQTGLQLAGNDINVNAYGVAADFLFPAAEGEKWEWGGKLGIASGDNPNTAVYEGYQFDKNYDVAMLLFNHRMGQADFLTTRMIHPNSSLTVGNSADDEAVGNAVYIAPNVKYAWNDKLDIKTTLIFAQLVTNPTLSLDTSKDLGTELDIELIYKPRERVIWSNELGVLLPGQAWKDGASNFDNKTNIGFTTKAAITF